VLPVSCVTVAEAPRRGVTMAASTAHYPVWIDIWEYSRASWSGIMLSGMGWVPCKFAGLAGR